MEKIYREGTGKQLLLLHGTGGDEHAMLEIASLLDPESTVLSFRGNVQEDGMNRFFKRNGLNQFDVDSLEKETDNLLEEIRTVSQEKNLALKDWVMVGYSNGANIAAHLLLERETELSQAILFHPMSLGVHTQKTDLSDKAVWASFGIGDPIVSDEVFNELFQAFDTRGAAIELEQTRTGHQLTIEEVMAAKRWLEERS